MFTEKVTGWHGFRLTLECAHLKLAGDRHWIGQAAICHVCPLTTHNPESPRVHAVAVRVIVAVDPVWAPKAPDTQGPEHRHEA